MENQNLATGLPNSNLTTVSTETITNLSVVNTATTLSALGESVAKTITAVTKGVAPSNNTTPGYMVVDAHPTSATYRTSAATTHWTLLWLPYFFLTLLLFSLTVLSFVRFHMLNGHRYHRKKAPPTDIDTEEESVDDDFDNGYRIPDDGNHVVETATTDDIFQIENHAVDSTFEQFKLYPKVFNGHHMSLTASAESPKPNSHAGSSSRGCVPIILRRSDSTGSILLETIYDTDV